MSSKVYETYLYVLLVIRESFEIKIILTLCQSAIFNLGLVSIIQNFNCLNVGHNPISQNVGR